MADQFTPAERSGIMRRVLSTGNRATEARMAQLFVQHGIKGWRRRWPAFGKPDFVFPQRRLAIFIDGCFWHGCPQHCRKPASNQSYWLPKLQRNRRRDLLVTRTLRAKGWRVLRIWEHELRRANEAALVRRLRRAISRERRCLNVTGGATAA